jgi:hypothetical protein
MVEIQSFPSPAKKTIKKALIPIEKGTKAL